MDDEEEQTRKQNLINQEIIAKGYNPEDLSNFIIRTRGIPWENLPYAHVQEIVEEFKTESCQLTGSSVTKSNKREEEEISWFSILYSQETFIINSKPQEPNEWLTLEKLGQSLTITVSNPQKIERGFFSFAFSQAEFVYTVTCKEINSSVTRSFEDFEWLRNKFKEIYPCTFVPKVLIKTIKMISKLEIITHDVYIRYINRFLEYVINKEILRSSLIFYKFLTWSKEEFAKLQDKDKDKTNIFVLKNTNIEDIPSLNSEYKMTLIKEDAIKANWMNTDITPTITWYDKLYNSVSSIAGDFDNWALHMSEVSSIMKELAKEGKSTKQSAILCNKFLEMESEFQRWSSFYRKQNEFFNANFKEFFHYMQTELLEIKAVWNEFDVCRFNFEDFGTRLQKKKDYLYSSKNYSKWEVAPGKDKIDFKQLEKNKKLCYSEMCYTETKEHLNNKRLLVYYINQLNDEYKSLVTYQGQKVEHFFKEIGKDKKGVLDGNNSNHELDWLNWMRYYNWEAEK